MSERRERINWPGAATLLAAVGAWEILVRTEIVSYDFLPAPSGVAASALVLMEEGVLWADLLHTMISIAIGWGAAMLVGVSLGLVLGLSGTLRRYLLASLEVLRPMPGIALAPIALVLFGFSMRTELVVTIFPALWPVLLNTMGGVANINRQLVDVGRTFRLGSGQITRRLLLPAALPSIVVGARLSLGIALVMAIVAEMVGNPQGLGYGIVREQQALRPDAMFAYIVVVGLVGLALNGGIGLAINVFYPAAMPRRAA